jgi:Putative amidase domain
MASERPVGHVYRARRLSPRRRRRRLFVVLVVLAAVVVGVVVARGGGMGGGRVVYDRAAAAAYADRWALSANPAYWHSRTDDCANFVSQCVAAGGLRAFDGAAGTWRPAGTRFPSLGWVNCTAQQRVWSTVGGGLGSPCIVSSTKKRPRDWAVGDVVYLGNTTAGVATWEHVIICVARKHGRWLYDSHTVAHRRLPMSKWYPAHFSLIRYCHLADTVSYR